MLFCNIRPKRSVFYDHVRGVQPIHDDRLQLPFFRENHVCFCVFCSKVGMFFSSLIAFILFHFRANSGCKGTTFFLIGNIFDVFFTKNAITTLQSTDFSIKNCNFAPVLLHTILYETTFYRNIRLPNECGR